MGVDLGSGKGKRAVDAELNLVPFIDLLSVCILFLLMTVVWVEISKMGAFSQAGGETLVEHSDRSSLRQEREDRDLEVLVTTQGIEIRREGQNLGRFELKNAAEKILELAGGFAQPESVKVSLRAEDSVIYSDVILVLDALFVANLVQVQIAGIN